MHKIKGIIVYLDDIDINSTNIDINFEIVRWGYYVCDNDMWDI